MTPFLGPFVFLWMLVAGESLSSAENCRCGDVNHGMRSAAGGSEIPLLFPWMVSVADENSKSFCGGVLINNQEVLTSARCVRHKKASQIRLVFGVHDLARVTPSDVRRIDKIIPHSKFHENTEGGYTSYDHDIAILHLKKEIEFAPNILPICLNSAELKGNFTVLGWGEQSADGEVKPQVLQMLTLPSREMHSCEKPWKKSFMEKKVICMGTKGHNICKGDYGGPLQSQWMEGKVDLVGIASTSGPSCGDKLPGLYVRFESVRKWIKHNSQLYSKCYK